MARKRKRRQSHSSAWHWRQTDCWYCTLPSTKKRVALFDENGQRIRGTENKEAAELALARLKLSGDGRPAPHRTMATGSSLASAPSIFSIASAGWPTRPSAKGIATMPSPFSTTCASIAAPCRSPS